MTSAGSDLILWKQASKRFMKNDSEASFRGVEQLGAGGKNAFTDSKELPRNSADTLVKAGTYHPLADQEPLAAMLRACE